MESIEELGSDQWFVALLNHACKIVIDTQQAANLAVMIYHAVQHHAIMKTVESEIVALIESLQEKKIPVIAQTARGTPILSRTLNQLKQIGIDISQQHKKVRINLEVNTVVNEAVYENGIIFCNSNKKGLCLNSFFEKTRMLPKKVIMVDDKEKYLQSAGRVVNGEYVGLRYGY